MLTKGFAVIAQDDPERVAIEAAGAQSVDQRGERRIAVVERVAVAPEVVARRGRCRVPGFRTDDGRQSAGR